LDEPRATGARGRSATTAAEVELRRTQEEFSYKREKLALVREVLQHTSMTLRLVAIVALPIGAGAYALDHMALAAAAAGTFGASGLGLFAHFARQKLKGAATKRRLARLSADEAQKAGPVSPDLPHGGIGREADDEAEYDGGDDANADA
jgi:hypothetical protein